MNPLPVLLSIPHGGTRIPPELIPLVTLDRYDIHDDIDPYVNDIYNLAENVTGLVNTVIARPFIDLNRAPHDRPPHNPDGVVKTTTCRGVEIYHGDGLSDETVISTLLKRYYYPYHRRIEFILHQHPEIELGLDCHTMAVRGPCVAPDRGKLRPTICLSNRNHTTCSRRMIEKLAAAFKKVFSLQDHEIFINHPFSGGYIIRHYANNTHPWIQIELNRRLYLSSPWYQRKGLKMDVVRLRQLNTMFAEVLELFFRC